MSLQVKDILFVPSIQHTGTWFTIKFLQHFIPNEREVFHILKSEQTVKGENLDDQQTTKPTILHSHFPIIRNFENMHIDMDCRTRQQLHVKNRCLPLTNILTFANIFKTVIPLRDPLAAMLTREARHPHLRHFFIVDNFIEVAQNFSDHPNVVFLPIDLYKTTEERVELLKRVARHCLIDVEENEKIVNKVGAEWEVQNVTPNNRFSELYKEGNINEINYLLGSKVAEVEYLKTRASIILPFLASVGYKKKDLSLW